MNNKRSFDLPQFAFNLRGMLVAVPTLAALLVTWNMYENGMVAWIAGGILFLLGLLIRIWAQQYLHFRLEKNLQLTTGGPYTLVRNPIYWGNTLICLGVTVAARMFWMAPIVLLWCCVVFTFVVAYEERYLIERYGEPYVEFTRLVPRWIPRFTKPSEKLWEPKYLGVSIKTELYNFLFLAPVVLKEFLTRGH